MATHLQTLFPEISEETLEAVLFQCGYDEDAAVTALLSMNEEPVPPSSAPPASTPAPVFACGGTTPPAGGLFTFGAGSGAAPVPESPALPPPVSPPAPPPASKAPVFAFGGTPPPVGGGQFTFGASSGAPAAPAHPAAPVFGASVAPALGAPPARRRPPMRARLDSVETDLERHMLEAALAASRLDAGASAEPPAAPNLTVGAKVRYGSFRGCTVAVLHADGSVDINVPGVGIHSRVAAPSFQIDDDDEDDEDGEDGEYERVLMPQRGRSVPPDSMEGVWSESYTAVSTSHHPTLRHGRGDKVLLPTTALAALTEAMEAQKGTPWLPNGPACMCAHCGIPPSRLIPTSRYAAAAESSGAAAELWRRRPAAHEARGRARVLGAGGDRRGARLGARGARLDAGKPPRGGDRRRAARHPHQPAPGTARGAVPYVGRVRCSGGARARPVGNLHVPLLRRCDPDPNG